MFINHNPNFVFVDIPKTGSRSVHKFLETNYTGRVGPSHEVFIPQQYANYYKFTVVRNPYDRVCSYWWAMCKRGDRYGYQALLKNMGLENTLLNFLAIVEKKYNNCNINTVHLSKDMHVVPQYKYIQSNTFDKIIKLENLEVEFRELPFVSVDATLLQLNSTTLPSPKPGALIRPPREELIHKEEGRRINEIYAKDFELLGYEKEDF